jgi:hypothetical protein
LVFDPIALQFPLLRMQCLIGGERPKGDLIIPVRKFDIIYNHFIKLDKNLKK